MRFTNLLIALCSLSVLAIGQNHDNSSAVQAASASRPTRQLELPSPDYQADFAPVVANGSHSVAWDKGHLVSFSPGEVKEPIILYDRTGKALFQNLLVFENATKTFVQDSVVTTSGNVVAAASVINADGASADLIVEIAPDGIRRVIQTSPFYPLKVCATGDGIVWAYGKELNTDRTAEPRTHYAMLREYSFEKGELRSALDRATVNPPKGVPVGGAKNEFQMKCNTQKVVLISGPTRELMEYDLSSSHLHRRQMAPLPDDIDITGITGAALTDSGEIYVSTHDGPNVKALTRILKLQPSPSGTTADWVPIVTIPSERRWIVLMGSEGESLVYSRGRREPTLFWSEIDKEGVK